MTNAELLAKIKTEIERLKAKYRKDMYKSSHEGLASGYKIEAYNELLSFLSTLESEKPMNQKELEREIERCLWQLSDDPSNEELRMFARHFAKWQKDKMMQEAVEGEITKDNRGNNVLRVGLFNNGFEVGDKVRMIVLPKED